MKFAYFVLPHVGGTYSVFRQLRRGLAAFDIDVQWLGMETEDYRLPVTMQEDRAFGSLVTVPPGLCEQARARLMAQVVAEEGFDGVFINVLGDRLATNIVRYLPEPLLRILIVHNITPGTYAAARSVRSYAHATIGVSQRCRDDLVLRHNFPEERTFAVPNAIDVDTFKTLGRRRDASTTGLRVLFAGRIEDASKGVFWLKEIMDALPDHVTLTLAGDGPDLPRLRQKLAPLGRRIAFLGALAPPALAEVMGRHDVLLMPSRFEGLGLTMIEAMAAGCVPVVSHIRGVTDTVVEAGVNGFLFPVGNYTAAAQAIARLDADRPMLQRMSEAARRAVPERFGIAEMARRYQQIITMVRNERPPIAPMLDIDHWSVPPGLRPGLRSFIPVPLKNWLRVVRERI